MTGTVPAGPSRTEVMAPVAPSLKARSVVTRTPNASDGHGLQHYGQLLSAYAQQMSTTPPTIGYAPSNSPVGLTAWIYAPADARTKRDRPRTSR